MCSRTRESEREKESAPLSREKTKKGRESLSFSGKKVKTLSLDETTSFALFSLSRFDLFHLLLVNTIDLP